MREALVSDASTISSIDGTAATLGGPALAVSCGVCIAAGAAYVVADDPSAGGGLTACPIRALTGQWCPGCGLTRATHHLLRGNVIEALSFNVLTPIALIGLVSLWWTWLCISTGRGTPRWVSAFSVRTSIVAGALVMAFTTVRNLPGWGWLRAGL